MSKDFQAVNPNFSLTAEELYVQILRDYEKARLPMRIGPFDALIPEMTRSPVAGFLEFNPLFAEVLCSVFVTDTDGKILVNGMRWGASDFGPDLNGDMMHFDIRQPRPL